MIKYLDQDVTVEKEGVSIYSGKNGMLILALSVESAMMLNIRRNLGLEKKPKQLNLHISLFKR